MKKKKKKTGYDAEESLWIRLLLHKQGTHYHTKTALAIQIHCHTQEPTPRGLPCPFGAACLVCQSSFLPCSCSCALAKNVGNKAHGELTLSSYRSSYRHLCVSPILSLFFFWRALLFVFLAISPQKKIGLSGKPLFFVFFFLAQTRLCFFFSFFSFFFYLFNRIWQVGGQGTKRSSALRLKQNKTNDRKIDKKKERTFCKKKKKKDQTQTCWQTAETESKRSTCHSAGPTSLLFGFGHPFHFLCSSLPVAFPAVVVILPCWQQSPSLSLFFASCAFSTRYFFFLRPV